MSYVPVQLARAVRLRAAGRCEYCRLPERWAALGFEVEHIIPVKHQGATALANLAFARWHCNRYKGPNIAAIMPGTRRAVALFHPREDLWHEHFEWRGALLVGKTDTGLVTIEVLRMNRVEILERRADAMEEGVW